MSPSDLHVIINGLPPGTVINVSAQHQDFFNITRSPGGTLGGEHESFSSGLVLHMQGTGMLSGFNRVVSMQAQSQVDTGPRLPGDPVQSFDTSMLAIQGQLPPGDPDFDLLRITAGSSFGMPSPGHTTLTQLPGGNWNVDSFFDITYRIDFVGHPGGQLGGMSGSTTGTIRMQGGTPLPGTQPCIVLDSGTGTVNLPPPGCGYLSPSAVHQIINGLPPGTTVNLSAEHSEFTNVVRTPGGALGGEHESFDSKLHLSVQGMGINRTIPLQVSCQTNVAPRHPGDPVQSFDTDMFSLQGQLPPGDPDFDLLRITAGSSFGMPSPGHTTLRVRSSGSWSVDSFFDITYRIDFIGKPGGHLGGMSGSTTATIRMQSGTPGPTPCVVVDDGSGTVSLPPPGCGYVSPEDLHKMINGLPPGTEVQIAARHDGFVSVTHQPGGSLGGELEMFGSNLKLVLHGTGMLSGYDRTINMPANSETQTGPRTPGDPVQSFDNAMRSLSGQLPPGDPDFDLLRITAGSAYGMPSPGHTTLTRLPSGNWNVDSFFDITYRIDFVGKPGGPLGGHSGSTTATIRMEAGVPTSTLPGCVATDNGTGTVNLPPSGCGYVSPDDLHKMLNGLPPGVEIHIAAQHDRFFNVTRNPGGSLGGEVETFSSTLRLNMDSTGTPGLLSRTIALPVQCQVHTGPRTPGAPVQSFANDMNGLNGQLPPGDPDFDLLRIQAGTAFGMPSPGHTTLTLQPTGDWKVDSFFDITYRIDFTGKPGGHLGGMSGSTTGTIRMQAAKDIVAPQGIPHMVVSNDPSGPVMSWTSVAGATSYDAVCGDLAALQASGGNFTVATNSCAANNTPLNSAPVSSSPSTGGTWCVVRPQNIGGIGTYDSGGGTQQGSRDAEIQAAAQACP